MLGEHILALAKWMSEYYLQPPGDVIFQCLPGYLRGARVYQPLRVKRWRVLADEVESIAALQQRSPRQFEICQALLQQPAGLTAVEFKHINPAWHTVVKALEGKQLIGWEWDDKPERQRLAPELPQLSSEQDDIVRAIEPRVWGSSRCTCWTELPAVVKLKSICA